MSESMNHNGGGAEIELPLTIFSSTLSSLEAITKYLKENRGLAYSEIAALVNRDPRTIWGTYHRSLKKDSQPHVVEADSLRIPVSVIKDRKLGVLEAVTLYLKDEKRMRYCQIAGVLHRDDRTIWTVYNRARRKLNEE